MARAQCSSCETSAVGAAIFAFMGVVESSLPVDVCVATNAQQALNSALTLAARRATSNHATRASSLVARGRWSIHSVCRYCIVSRARNLAAGYRARLALKMGAYVRWLGVAAALEANCDRPAASWRRAGLTTLFRSNMRGVDESRPGAPGPRRSGEAVSGVRPGAIRWAAGRIRDCCLTPASVVAGEGASRWRQLRLQRGI